MAIQLTAVMGPLFTLKILNVVDESNLTIEVGVKSSSLFAANAGGTASKTLNVSITGAEAIGIYRAVTIQGTLCNSTAVDLAAYAGIAKGSIAVSQEASVVRVGLIVEPTWTWAPNSPVFISANGVLTQTAPALPLRRIGYAISATQIILDPQPTIGA